MYVCQLAISLRFLLIFTLCMFISFTYYFSRQRTINQDIRRGIHFDPNVIYAECSYGNDGKVNIYGIVDFRIIVLTYNRHLSLQRLLNSINKAHFDGDKVVLDIWIDCSETGDIDKDTLEVANKFSFGAGIKRVCFHSKHVGILGQWIATWKPPKNEKEIAVILEDDLTVSPFFWKFLKLTHKRYGRESNLNGISLTSRYLKFTPSQEGVSDLFKLDTKHRLFRYSALGTWGFSPNRLNWFRFAEWFKVTYSNSTYFPFVANHIATDWYNRELKRRSEDSNWSMWHMHWAWLNSEYTLSPNFPDGRSFCFNWKEKGVHFTGEDVETDSNEDYRHLIQEWKPEFDELPRTPVALDNDGNIVSS